VILDLNHEELLRLGNLKIYFIIQGTKNYGEIIVTSNDESSANLREGLIPKIFRWNVQISGINN
jgi:hypothetical protein